MSTFHYLPSSCELDIRFQATNFQNPEVEKVPKKPEEKSEDYCRPKTFAEECPEMDSDTRLP